MSEKTDPTKARELAREIRVEWEKTTAADWRIDNEDWGPHVIMGIMPNLKDRIVAQFNHHFSTDDAAFAVFANQKAIAIAATLEALAGENEKVQRERDALLEMYKKLALDVGLKDAACSSANQRAAKAEKKLDELRNDYDAAMIQLCDSCDSRGDYYGEEGERYVCHHSSCDNARGKELLKRMEALAGECERLESVSVNIAQTQDANAMAQLEAIGMAGRFTESSHLIDEMGEALLNAESECERLKALVKEAFIEAHCKCNECEPIIYETWDASNAKRELEKEQAND